MTPLATPTNAAQKRVEELRVHRTAFIVMAVLFAVAPAVVYPVFMMKVMCFALFACAFNLLLGFGGLLSFGHAMFLGAVVTGFGLGLIEGLTKVFYPEASATVIFIIMAIVLLVRPAGLFGTQK